MAAPRNDDCPGTIPLGRNRDYLLLWSGQLVSSFGTQMSLLAFPLLMLALTHSPAAAGLLGAVRAIPYLFLSLPVGALVDRWNRKRVMVISDAGRALAMGSIPLAVWIGRLSRRLCRGTESGGAGAGQCGQLRGGAYLHGDPL